MPKLLDPGRQITDDTTALPVASGAAYFSDVGTTNEKTVYSDSALTTPISQPITLDSEGRFPAPPYASGAARLQVYDSSDTGSRDGVLVFDEDDVRGASDFSDLTLTAPLKADDSTSTAAPVYTFDGDTDTGVGHPAADTVTISAGGTEYVRLTSAGRFGLGTSAPEAAFHNTSSSKLVGPVYAALASSAFVSGQTISVTAPSVTEGDVYQVVGTRHTGAAARTMGMGYIYYSNDGAGTYSELITGTNMTISVSGATVSLSNDSGTASVYLSILRVQ